MRIGLFFILFFITQILLAQNRCATVAPTSGEFENWVESKILQKKLQQDQNSINQPTVYEIPVVIHVIHRGEETGEGVNLSNERIQGQIDSLNADFRRTNADALNTPSVFEPVAADVEIQFVLAKQDPKGNPTNGIIRKIGERNSYNIGSHKSNLRSEIYWPPENYLNIYVVDLIGYLGFASFPNTSLQGISFGNDENLFDGILVDYQYFGVNPSAPSFESLGRTLTHELGHYLGLRHIWGDGGCGVDDFVNDTPPADNDNSGLASPCTFPNPNDGTVCETDEMFQNYMDYTDDICMNLFTEGQKARMRTVMENSPRRVSLSSSLGLIEPSRFENDLAVIKIASPTFAECEQNVIPEFEVSNYGINVITSFEASLIIDGELVNTIQYATSLPPLENEIFAFSPQGLSIPSQIEININEVNELTDEDESNNRISKTISFINSVGLPYYEDFENTNTVLGRTGSSEPWEVQIAPKESAGNQALKFKAFQNPVSNGDETIIKTPIFNLSGFNSAELNFSYSHATLTNGFWDGLIVKVSTDCGKTFESNQLFSRFGNSLSQNKESPNSYTPTGQNDWQEASINITPYAGMDGVQFAFVGLNGNGNNIYIDDIEIIQTDLNANDISPIDIQAPLVTCKDKTFILLKVRNVGFQPISSFQAEYDINNTISDSTFSELSIGSGQFQTFRIIVENLIDGENTINLKTTLVNNQQDDNIGNSLHVTIIKNTNSNEFPLKVDFESPDDWSLASINRQLWQRTSINGNSLLKAEAFDSSDITSQSWFVSPVLSTGGLDSAGLYFRGSYSSRQGFNDQLEVRVSLDCGESYGLPILIANSDSLAVSQTSSAWRPSINEDWKEYRLDLSSYLPFKENIRIAFIFTNGGGNNLYIDDISIRSNEEPSYKNTFRVFPNPATTDFNVGLNLNKKEKIVIQLMDMTGKIIFEDSIDNALNQIRSYSNISLSGLYFIRVIGEDFVSSQKIFFNRN